MFDDTKPRFLKPRTTLQSRRTKLVAAAIHSVVERDGDGFTQAQVSGVLRANNSPMGAWEVRGELSILESAGEIRNDAATGKWFLTAPAANSKARSA